MAERAENPLARSLPEGAWVEGAYACFIHPDGRPGTVALPRPVEGFLCAFEEGRYPDLIEPRAAAA